MKTVSDKPIAVVKVGGDVLLDSLELSGLCQNIKQLVDQNWHVVVVHGGGPQTNRLQAQLGLEALKIAGRRVTKPVDLIAVLQAIAGEVNVALTAALLEQGVMAFGCHGASGRLVEARKRPPMPVPGETEAVDYGEVGDITQVNHKLLRGLLNLNLIPVIATLGIGEAGRLFNINADTTVAEIAKSLQADCLLLTTQVGAIFEDLDDPSTRIKRVTPSTVKSLIESGVIQGGMIPKTEESVALLDVGVKKIAIVSGREPNTFRSVINDSNDVGTQIVND